MSAIRGRGNKSTELRFLKLLKESKITGWRRHYKIATYRPDFVFLKQRVVVYLDGCFWHGCPLHFKSPQSNIEFWQLKIEINMQRDISTDKMLAAKQWRIVRIWEHDLKKYPDQVVERISSELTQVHELNVA